MAKSLNLDHIYPTALHKNGPIYSFTYFYFSYLDIFAAKLATFWKSHEALLSPRSDHHSARQLSFDSCFLCPFPNLFFYSIQIPELGNIYSNLGGFLRNGEVLRV